MRRYLYVAFLLITVLLMRCPVASASQPAQPKPKDSEVTYPYNEVITKLTYPYEMSTAEKKRLIESLKTMRPGEPYKAAVKLLGPPFIQQLRGPKEGDAITGSTVEYYVKKIGDGVSMNDQFVDLNFDNDKKLVDIDVQNSAEICKQITKLPVTEGTWDNTTGQMKMIRRKADNRTEEGKLPSKKSR